MPSLEEVEKIERLVRAILPHPYGGTEGYYERYTAAVHETILFYIKLPHGLELLQKKKRNMDYNKRQREKYAETDDVKYLAKMRSIEL